MINLTVFSQLCYKQYILKSACYLVACEHGEELNEDNTCEICPQGTYRTVHVDLSCISCQDGRTTTGPGATSQADCTRGNLILFSCLVDKLMNDKVADYYFSGLPTNISGAAVRADS